MRQKYLITNKTPPSTMNKFIQLNYANKFYHLEKMNIFKKSYQTKLNQVKFKNLYRFVFTKNIDSIVKNLSTEKIPSPDRLIGFQNIKNINNSKFIHFCVVHKQRFLSNIFLYQYKLYAKTKQENIPKHKKKNCSLLCSKILIKILVNLIQQCILKTNLGQGSLTLVLQRCFNIRKMY